MIMMKRIDLFNNSNNRFNKNVSSRLEAKNQIFDI